MNIKIHSSELNRMMKTIVQCIDSRDQQNLSNIEIVYDNNLLTIRGSNGQFSAVMSTPVLGGDGETFCVDGTLFARVCAMCNGDIDISTDEKICTIKGAGRTRLPVVNAKIPAFERVEGEIVTVNADDFAKAYGGVAHAVSVDQGRLVLTGVLTETSAEEMRMTALDGFRLAVESVKCSGDEIKADIPAGFMRLVANSAISGENIALHTDGKRIHAETDGMLLACGLLSGAFPPVETMIPKEFGTEVRVDAESLKNALKASSVINNANKLVRFAVSEGKLTVMNNSEKAAYEAELVCDTQGDPMAIAFNQKYIMESMNSIDSETVTIHMNAPTRPAVMDGNNGIRLVLPVRVAG